MNLLLDTHLLLWTAGNSARLTSEARTLIDAPENTLHFSAASIWEIAIKASRSRSDFTADPALLHRALLENGYVDLAITSAHAIAVKDLPPFHGDPFDRLLVAQAISEGLLLLTADKLLAQYPGPVRLV